LDGAHLVGAESGDTAFLYFPEDDGEVVFDGLEGLRSPAVGPHEGGAIPLRWRQLDKVFLFFFWFWFWFWLPGLSPGDTWG
jgi:hypothetical protein